MEFTLLAGIGAPRIARFLVALFLTLSAVSFARAVGGNRVTPKVANVHVLLEAQSEALGIVGLLVGGDPSKQLSWTGAFSDETWSFNMSTSYRDGAIQMNYSGELDQITDLATWTGRGSFSNSAGNLTWTTTGSYTDATKDGNWFATLVIGAATILADVAVVGVQVLATSASTGTLTAPVATTSIKTIGAITATGIGAIATVNTFNQQGESHLRQDPPNSAYLPPFSGNLPPLLQPTQAPIAVDTSSTFFGAESDSVIGLTAFSTVSAVPEPSTYGAITAALTIGLCAIRTFRNNNRSFIT